MATTPKQLIINTLAEKSVMKQVVCRNTTSAFNKIESILKRMVEELNKEVANFSEAYQ